MVYSNHQVLRYLRIFRNSLIQNLVWVSFGKFNFLTKYKTGDYKYHLLSNCSYPPYEILYLNILELFETIDCCLNCPKFNPIISLFFSFVCSWNFFASSSTPDLNSPHYIAFLAYFPCVRRTSSIYQCPYIFRDFRI